jgi:hypothetical protein
MISPSLTPLRARLLIELLHTASMTVSHFGGIYSGAAQIDGSWVPRGELPIDPA